MITKFNQYINENLESSYDNPLIQIFYDFFKKYLVDNNVEKYNIISEFDRGPAFELSLNDIYHNSYISIDFNDDNIDVYYNNTEEHYLSDDYEYVLKKLKKYLDRFYTSFKSYFINFNPEFCNIPITNIDKFCDFIEYLIINNDKIKDLKDNYYSIIELFKEFYYDNERLKDLRTIFDEKLGHYLNANNFNIL